MDLLMVTFDYGRLKLVQAGCAPNMWHVFYAKKHSRKFHFLGTIDFPFDTPEEEMAKIVINDSYFNSEWL